MSVAIRARCAVTAAVDAAAAAPEAEHAAGSAPPLQLFPEDAEDGMEAVEVGARLHGIGSRAVVIAERLITTEVLALNPIVLAAVLNHACHRRPALPRGHPQIGATTIQCAGSHRLGLPDHHLTNATASAQASNVMH